MGWTDRDYNQSKYGGRGGPLLNLLTGSVHLFNFKAIDVRAHSSLFITVILVLIFGLGPGFTWEDRVESMSMLFVIVLLHEFGHCFTARWVGGEADQILMTPLGGLAFARPPHRPLPTFLTVAGGPLVNVLICMICWIVVALSNPGSWNWWNPFHAPAFMGKFGGWFQVWRYTYWIYATSYSLLLFNLLPIYPLDGGQLLQSVLWPKLGFIRSTNISCIVGMVGSVIMTVIGLINGSPLLMILFIQCGLYCMQRRMEMKMMAAELGFAGEGSEMDFSESLKPDPPRKRLSARAIRRAQKAVLAEHSEQDRVDAILAKVSATGMGSLTWFERRILHQATARKRKHEAELTRDRR